MGESVMYKLHDQRDDATIDRYSIFKDGKIILIFNVVEGGLTAKEVFIASRDMENVEWPMPETIP